MKIGRNDPCHCGGGKKYKKCCLAGDEAVAARERPAVVSTDYSAALPGYSQTGEMLRKLAALSPGAKAGKFQHLLDEVQPILTFMERREEIDLASQALEAHRAEFEELMNDEVAYLERVRALFGEERFCPVWFNKEAVARALEQVGFVRSMVDDDAVVESLRAAILHLADKDTRGRLSMALLGSLPDYVAAGRFLDGWIVQDCANLTVNVPDESNPLLFELFSRGYDAWAAEKHAAETRLLREFGMDKDRLTRMSLDEIDAWVAQQSTPEARARLEAIFKAHPDQAAISTENFERIERESATLLEREDALPLLLSADEVAPWVPRLVDCFQRVAQACPPTPVPPRTQPQPEPWARRFGPSLAKWPERSSPTGRGSMNSSPGSGLIATNCSRLATSGSQAWLRPRSVCSNPNANPPTAIS